MDSDTTIEGAGYRGVPNPDIRCSDRHLADAEDISLRLSFCVRRVVIRAEIVSSAGARATVEIDFGL
jgi:hypothetical protein